MAQVEPETLDLALRIVFGSQGCCGGGVVSVCLSMKPSKFCFWSLLFLLDSLPVEHEREKLDSNLTNFRRTPLRAAEALPADVCACRGSRSVTAVISKVLATRP